MIARAQLIFAIALIVAACTDRNSEDTGRVDDWTWDEPELKTRTSPNREKRARADARDGEIELKFGEAGADHPVDIMIYHTEIIPEPKNGKWDMKWLDDERFVFNHPDLGTKTWQIEGVIPMTVTVSADWQQPVKP